MCLARVEPFQQNFEKSFKVGEFDDLFVVLKEYLHTTDSYLIAYNPRGKNFGFFLQGGVNPVNRYTLAS
jgi:hypothetical protein